MIVVTPARAVALLAIALGTATLDSGCGGAYHPDVTSSADAASDDAATTVDGTTSDAGSDANACGADLGTDAKNCGRCGHDCLGGVCESGACSAVQLGAPGGPLKRILLAGASIFVSTVTSFSSEVSGLFRLAKSGGTLEAYTPYPHAEAMSVLGDTLYFVVNDPLSNPGGDSGGLFSCPLVGPAPCSPTLIAAANSPSAIATDRGRVFYNEKDSNVLMVYAPPGPPTAFRTNSTSTIGAANNIYVDGDDAFFSVSVLGPPFPQNARLFELPPGGGQLDTYSYASPVANDGRLFGTADALFYTAFDFGATSAGIVRRIPRGTGAPCDLGGSTNLRPFGIYADATNVYWANQGTGSALPYTNGSLVFCAQTSCCTKPTGLWKGGPQPTAVTGDADALYFVTQTGSVWKIAKP